MGGYSGLVAGNSGADAELARRIRAREADAENELVHQYERDLYSSARGRVGSARAEDLVQETLALALVSLRCGAYRGRGPLAAYLATILRRSVRRSASDRGRFSAVEVEAIAGPGPDPLAAAEQVEQRLRLRDAVASLAPPHRDVVRRHYFDEQSVGEIARRLAVPRGTILSRLYHARRKIARALARSEVSPRQLGAANPRASPGGSRPAAHGGGAKSSSSVARVDRRRSRLRGERDRLGRLKRNDANESSGRA